ncbi:unnamed protein product [Lactuca virosa]|uniref:Cytochrome c-type biogenesis protein n=1 Tax=Lactuca virosa TaxID=75947 RepID=A0AAU9M825_9ASTR|nr:unnamed protein product [Lactuca virosa]
MRNSKPSTPVSPTRCQRPSSTALGLYSRCHPTPAIDRSEAYLENGKRRGSKCGSQSIEESQADIAVLLRKLIRDEIRSGKSDKDIYKKLEDDYGETILYAPKFDWQTAAFWLSPLLIAGAAGGIWAYERKKQCWTFLPLHLQEYFQHPHGGKTGFLNEQISH